MPTRRSASPANRSASSPSTNTGVGPRKCTPTIAAPAFTARTRSAREGIGTCASLTLADTALEALADSVDRQVAADKHDTAIAGFAILPRTLMVSVEDHVHALKHEALGVVLE